MIPKDRIPTHPGEVLLTEFLEPMGIPQTRLAEHIEVPVQRVNELVNGKRGITPETAWKLAGALGTTPEFWTNLQAAYELAKGRPAEAPGLVDPLWEIRRCLTAVADAAQDALGRRGPDMMFVGVEATVLEATPEEVRFSFAASGYKRASYEEASREIAEAYAGALGAVNPALLKSRRVKDALDTLRAVKLKPRTLNTVEALIVRAGGIAKVRIWKQAATGVSATLPAARNTGQGRGIDPWVGGGPGFKVSLTATQYEELKRRGAVEEKPHIS